MNKSIPFRLVQIEDDGYHPVVKAYYNRRPINLVVDTGASRTVFDLKLLRHLTPFESEHMEPLAAGISAQQFSVSLYRLERFTMSRIAFTNFEVVGTDLSALSALYRTMAGFPLHGMLGSDFMYRYAALIDYSQQAMRIRV